MGAEYLVRAGHASRGTTVTSLILCRLGVHGYSIFLRWYCGATLGEQLMRLRVRDLSEAPISLWQSVLRETTLIAHDIYGGGGAFLLGSAALSGAGSDGRIDWILTALLTLDGITIVSNAKRRSLDDFIAGTVVVRADVQPVSR